MFLLSVLFADIVVYQNVQYSDYHLMRKHTYWSSRLLKALYAQRLGMLFANTISTFGAVYWCLLVVCTWTKTVSSALLWWLICHHLRLLIFSWRSFFLYANELLPQFMKKQVSLVATICVPLRIQKNLSWQVRHNNTS